MSVQENAAAQLAQLGLKKLNDYSHNKGGRGGLMRGGTGMGFSHGRGRRPDVGGGSPSGFHRPIRARTLARKLARSKGTNRQLDKVSGKAIGTAASLSRQKEEHALRLKIAEGNTQKAGSTGVGKLARRELNKSSSASASGKPPVKKARLLPSSDPNEALPAPDPALLMAGGLGSFSGRDALGRRAWDLDEETRYYEQQLGIRKIKKHKAHKLMKDNIDDGGDASDSDMSDDAELDEGAMKKFKQELAEDGLDDLFDFCEMLEGDDEEGAANEEEETKHSPASSSHQSGLTEKQRRILEKEAELDRKQTQMEEAFRKAMEKDAAAAKQKKAKGKKEMKEEVIESDDNDDDDGEEVEDEEEGMEDDEDEEEDADMEDDEDDEDESEEDAKDDDAAVQSQASRKRRRENESDEEASDDGDDSVESEPESEQAENDDAATTSVSPPAQPSKQKGMSTAELYGFDAPVPESLLAFRRGESNLLSYVKGGNNENDGEKKDTSTLASIATTAKYIPPALRAKMASASASGAAGSSSTAIATAAAVASSSSSPSSAMDPNATLRRQLKGLLNRLTEQNLEHIALQITGGAYAEHPKRLVTDILVEELLALCTREAHNASGGYSLGMNSSTMLASAALVVYLHASMGHDLGAHVLERFVATFQQLHGDACLLPGKESSATPGIQRSCTALVTFITYLYLFDLVAPSPLITELLSALIEEFRPDSVELIVVTLVNVGYYLRKNAPADLKNIVLAIQNQTKKYQQQQQQNKKQQDGPAADQADASSSIPSSSSHIPPGRMAFMLDLLSDLKNNKRRHSSLADSITPLQNWLQGKLKTLSKSKKKKNETSGNQLQLRIGYEDIRCIPERGRWWLVGSAWKGKRIGEEDENHANETSSANGPPKPSSSTPPSASTHLPSELPSDEVDLLSLARKHRMHTDVRKSLFLVLMSAVDFMDCFEKICKMPLLQSAAASKDRDRQLVSVLMECCGAETNFNPYYAYVARQFSRVDGNSGKEFKFTFQLAIWDFVRDLTEEEVSKAARASGATGSTAKANYMKQRSRSTLNIAKMLAILLCESPGNGGGGLPLSVLKCFHFSGSGSLPPLQLLFLTATMKEFLLAADEKHIRQSMMRLHALSTETGSSQSKKKPSSLSSMSDVESKRQEVTLLREGLDYFLQRHMLPATATMKDTQQANVIRKRISMARKALEGQLDDEWMFK